MERSLGEGKGYPLQYSGLDLNPVSGLCCKESDRTKWLTLSLFIIMSMTDIWQLAMVRSPWDTFQIWQETKKESFSRLLNHSSCLPFMLISFWKPESSRPMWMAVGKIYQASWVFFFLNPNLESLPDFFLFFERYIRCHVLLFREEKKKKKKPPSVILHLAELVIFQNLLQLTSCCFSCLKHSWVLACRQCHIITMQRKHHTFSTVQMATKSWTWLRW